jgi:hypothetical protein
METRAVLLKADKVSVVFERGAFGEIRVTTSSWDDAVVILPNQVLEVAIVGKQVGLVRVDKPVAYLDIDDTGSSERVTVRKRDASQAGKIRAAHIVQAEARRHFGAGEIGSNELSARMIQARDRPDPTGARDDAKVILPNQVLEAAIIGKQVGLVRVDKPIAYWTSTRPVFSMETREISLKADKGERRVRAHRRRQNSCHDKHLGPRGGDFAQPGARGGDRRQSK